VNGQGSFTYGRYQHDGRPEWLLRIGDAGARPILFLPPLFEEMNRTRSFIVDLMRRLARRGFGCWLPDLPGTAESERRLPETRWADWREAAGSAGEEAARPAGRQPLVVSVRGGSLLDDAVAAACRWRFAPVAGESLSRDLTRAGLVSGTEYAGYRPDQELMESLATALPAPLEKVRTVRLASDRDHADLRVDGPALWRRSEPGNAPELALALANDLETWAERCAAS
jgi:pimeloyl-ACP methyl ester carboxylesterase